MKLSAIAFLLGICSIYFFDSLPAFLPFLIALFFSTIGYFYCLKRKLYLFFKLLSIFLLGILWMLYCSAQILSWTLADEYLNTPVLIEGTIANIPMGENMSLNFLFHMKKFNHTKTDTYLKLSWYKTKKNKLPDLKVGDSWRFSVKLKPPHNLKNAGSFDNEKFLFSKGIRATGYVFDKQNDAVFLESTLFSYWSCRIRQKLLKNMHSSLAGRPYADFIYALTMGEKFEITAQQWQVFQNTGTSHLMAISGLHISLIAGLFFLFVQFFWRKFSFLDLVYPANQAASMGALIGALIYSALAGFAIPTQRALIMLLVFLLGVLYRRYMTAWYSVALALIVVLIVDPLSVLTIAFWLSFGAIALLAFGLGARFNMNTLWWKYGRTQWVVSIGLIPLTLLFFSNASFISPIANSLAIPWVGFITVPLSLLGALFSFIAPVLGDYILIFAELTLHPIWEILQFLSSFSFFSWQPITNNSYLIFLALLGILLGLSPKGIPYRYLGIFFVIPFLFSNVPHPSANTVWFTLLEVGQGLSAVVQTEHHVLVFDTGPKLSANYDMGRTVILPFLRNQGIRKIDRMVISHADNDHIGGSASLLEVFPKTEVITSVPEHFQNHRVKTCLRGEHWNWDGVNFEFLYPTLEDLGQGNNSSCVLKISLDKQQVLLTGDIEKRAEKILLQHSEDLASSILIVPHHGSKTSSSEDFVSTINPKIALFPTGYLNRFHFPKELILDRYKHKGAAVYDTAKNGAISIKWDLKQSEPEIDLFSNKKTHLWNYVIPRSSRA